MTALRAWAKREPILAIRLVGALAALIVWAGTRWLDVNLDTSTIVAIASLALGLDTLVSHESVVSPATSETRVEAAKVATALAIIEAPAPPPYTPEQAELDRHLPKPPVGLIRDDVTTTFTNAEAAALTTKDPETTDEILAKHFGPVG